MNNRDKAYLEELCFIAANDRFSPIGVTENDIQSEYYRRFCNSLRQLEKEFELDFDYPKFNYIIPNIGWEPKGR